MKQNSAMKFVLLALTMFAISCKSTHQETASQQQNTTDHQANQKHDEHAHWAYRGEEDPAHWSNISEEYKECAGHSQSPINIVDNGVTKGANHTLELNYTETGVKIKNNGHTEQFDITEKNSLVFDGKEYFLKQFHLHALSEHTVDGKHFPLEIHFVNQAKDGSYAVISVLVEEGMTSSFFDKYLSHFPKVGEEYDANEKFALYEVMSCNEHFYHYQGSFTTPPCTEEVEWIVLKEKATASKEQLEKLHEILGDNFRPVQSLNGRKIELQ